jgi:murein L,D-transpeptidase YcbB/YkuD
MHMHGRSRIAVIVAAAPALVFAASAQVEVFAEDVAAEQPAAAPSVSATAEAAPEAPKVTPVTTVAVPAPPVAPSEQDASPQPPTGAIAPASPPPDAASSPEGSATPEASAASSPVPADPVVEKIRAKLADPEFKSGAAPEDVAALQVFYAGRSEPLWITPMGVTAEAQAVIDEIASADDWGLSATAFELPPAGELTDAVDEEATAEIKLSLAVLKYARFARGGRANPSSLSNLLDLTPPLKDPKMVMAEVAAAEEADAYLRGLHPKHEQFKRLHEALLKARGQGDAEQKKASPRDVERILVNMERWRWMPEDLGAFYVQDNVPEFMLYVVKDGKTIHADKIVVGKLAYATPIFSANMQTVVFNPEWTVPPTIVRENLLPSLRGGGGWFSGGSSVLRQHGLKVKYNGRVVDPGSINWSSVNMANIAFVQAPGPTNVLGKVKFLYPNKHIVYMHDTIKPNLFKSAVRAEGHNCIRMEKPARLAEILLAEDKGWDTKKVQELIAKGYDASVTLDKPFPVHTTYFTATVDDQGNLATFGDVYGLDRKVAAVVLGKSAPIAGGDETSSIPTPETTAAVEPKPKKDVAADAQDLFDMAR